MKVIVSRHYHGEAAWCAYDENYSGPPEHIGTGRTPDEAVHDLLMWLDPEEELGTITVEQDGP